ncbi:MAG: hypothetical protein M4579_003126 [Chaenotheca gracillima]|nr:MAG: hypothetical protein M4579_003126 [Chaenotheca gracillima]
MAQSHSGQESQVYFPFGAPTTPPETPATATFQFETPRFKTPDLPHTISPTIGVANASPAGRLNYRLPNSGHFRSDAARSSSFTSSQSGPESDGGTDAYDTSPTPSKHPGSRSRPNFTIEEIGGDSRAPESDLDIIRPDQYEDAESEWAESESSEASSEEEPGPQDRILRDFEEMCVSEAGVLRGRHSRCRAGKKRWRTGIFKRSHSQTVGSDSNFDSSTSRDSRDVPYKARRMRRRVRGPSHQGSSLAHDTLAAGPAVHRLTTSRACVDIPNVAGSEDACKVDGRRRRSDHMDIG